MARVWVEWRDEVKEVCKEYTWNNIGYSRPDIERLWVVAAALDDLILNPALP